MGAIWALQSPMYINSIKKPRNRNRFTGEAVEVQKKIPPYLQYAAVSGSETWLKLGGGITTAFCRLKIDKSGRKLFRALDRSKLSVL